MSIGGHWQRREAIQYPGLFLDQLGPTVWVCEIETQGQSDELNITNIVRLNRASIGGHGFEVHGMFWLWRRSVASWRAAGFQSRCQRHFTGSNRVLDVAA